MIRFSDFKKTLRPILLILICATVAFVWINSVLPPETSSEQSGAVQDFIEEVVPDEFDFKEFLIENIRKVGHFTEYGLLGIFVALYVFIYCEKKLRFGIPAGFAFAFAVGFLDESIQILSGRGPAISDVWIDAFGFTVFSVITFVISLGVKFTVRAVKARKTAKTDGKAN